METGDVLFSFVRPYLENIAKVTYEYSHCIASTGFYVCTPSELFVPDFMYYVMISRYVIDGLNQFMKGDNSPSIRKEEIESWLYPIPPIQEQNRIIKALDEALILVEHVKSSQNNLSTHIGTVKSKILDLAIKGKLVPQDPNDEPASVLLKRIKAEKEELVKAGKIKRDKKESVIFKGEDNSYYYHVENGASVYDEKLELPYNWIPCTILDISYSVGNKDNQVQTNEVLKEGLFPVVYPNIY